MHLYAGVCGGMQGYAEVCKGMQRYAREDMYIRISSIQRKLNIQWQYAQDI